jgi:hypothetical protein
MSSSMSTFVDIRSVYTVASFSIALSDVSRRGMARERQPLLSCSTKSPLGSMSHAWPVGRPAVAAIVLADVGDAHLFA